MNKLFHCEGPEQFNADREVPCPRREHTDSTHHLLVCRRTRQSLLSAHEFIRVNSGLVMPL
ncbi:hypothetical protein L1080_016405 [Rhodococcus sp. MSC1_016]|uniref:hypothetical protein n=1 Tax=Rhodococcus sp. MSC1_016 TaxID=2909266 RepID=UPI00202DF340|nr:hypothetical protein [Rhodococcus sp. MSC1_016]